MAIARKPTTIFSGFIPALDSVRNVRLAHYEGPANFYVFRGLVNREESARLRAEGRAPLEEVLKIPRFQKLTKEEQGWLIKEGGYFIHGHAGASFSGRGVIYGFGPTDSSIEIEIGDRTYSCTYDSSVTNDRWIFDLAREVGFKVLQLNVHWNGSRVMSKPKYSLQPGLPDKWGVKGENCASFMIKTGNLTPLLPIGGNFSITDVFNTVERDGGIPYGGVILRRRRSSRRGSKRRRSRRKLRSSKNKRRKSRKRRPNTKRAPARNRTQVRM